MSLCLLAGARAVALGATAFTLSWTHSVEKVRWEESWRLAGDGLVLTEARVKGSGAGMEPGPDAVLEDGWWVWRPSLPPLPALVLAASGATTGGWTLCTAAGCRVVGAEPGPPLRIRPCGTAR